MIDSMYIIDVNGERFDFTIGDAPSVPYYPVKSYDVSIESRGARNNRAQAHGVWPGPTYMGGATITFEGSVFGDTYTVFNDNVMALLYATHPISSPVARDNVKVGTIYLKPTGQVKLQSDYAFESFTCPRDGNTHADWQWSIYCFDPFFTESLTGNRIMF